MASIVSYRTKTGSLLYRVRYRKPGTNKSTDKSGFKRKKDAQDWAAIHAVEVLTGGYIDPAAGKTEVARLAPAWLAKKKMSLAPSYYDDVEGAWRNHVEPAWGTRKVNDIRKSDVQMWVTKMATDEKDAAGEIVVKGKSATVVKRAAGVLRGILDDAMDSNMVAKNAAAGLEYPQKSHKAHVYLTSEQLLSLAHECGTKALLILVLGLVGLRWGEAIGLRVKDVNLKRHRMRIRGSATQVRGEIDEGSTKGKKSRSVVFPKVLDKGLRKAMEGKGPEDLLFTGTLPGGFMRQVDGPRTRSNWFSSACDRAGIPRMTIHDLRHTAASLMVKSGANVKAVQRQLGHASAAMTLDIYADLFDDDLTAVGESMNDLLLENSPVGFSWDFEVETAA
jgi:integrase